MAFEHLTDRARFAAREHMASLRRKGAEFTDPDVASMAEASFESGYLRGATDAFSEAAETLVENRAAREREIAEMAASRTEMERLRVESETRQNEHAESVKEFNMHSQRLADTESKFESQLAKVEAMKMELRELLDRADKQRAQIAEKQRVLDARLAETGQVQS